MIILIGIVTGTLSFVFFIGYRLGGYFSRKLAKTVKEQNELLRQYCFDMGNAARSTNQLSSDIAQQQFTNITQTMGIVVTFLQTVQSQHAHALDTHEQEQVQRLIKQARQVASPQ